MWDYHRDENIFTVDLRKPEVEKMTQRIGFWELNEQFLKKAIYIEESLKQYNPVLYQYDFDLEEGTTEICINSKYVDYFWIEFHKNNTDYKVTLFYKDFDASTGNIHVLPGGIQIWEKSLEKAKSNSHEAMKKKKRKIVVFSENEWYPLLNSYHSVFDINLKDILDIYCIEKTDAFFDIDVNVFANNIPSRGGRGKYSIMRWKEHSRPKDGCFYTLYYTWLDRGGFWFTKYGDVLFWSHENDKTGSPHEYEDKSGWKLNYPRRKKGCNLQIDNLIKNWEKSEKECYCKNSGINIYDNDYPNEISSEINRAFEEYCNTAIGANKNS